MNQDEDNQEMTALTLASSSHANASAEPSDSNNDISNGLSLVPPGFEAGSSSKQPNGEGSSDGGGGSNYRYKGVVPQQNGHWGAQLYADQRRIWLGTFKTENEAALAYDRASIKLRSDDSYKNLEMSPAMLTLESNFQSIYSENEVLLMIKDGTYQNKLGEFCRRCQCHPEHVRPPVMRLGGVNDSTGEGIVYTESFEKELTPSDVGKLNRLVIPKKYATKFFTQLNHVEAENGGSELADTEVQFLDMGMNGWKFRYCYWKSSQSFVFTKGWNKFVKEKELKTKDVVLFFKCEKRPGPGISGEPLKFLMIDVRHCPPQLDNAQPQLEGAGVEAGRVEEEPEGQQSGEMEELEMNEGPEEDIEVEEERRVIKLFGVEIDPNQNA